MEETLKNPFILEAHKIILSTIPLDEYVIFVFGSRAGKNFKDYSDLDVGVWGEHPIPLSIFYQVKELLEESTIPYKVDIIDFRRASDDFKKIALEKIQIWNQPAHLKVN